jgi:hypothetical protein
MQEMNYLMKCHEVSERKHLIVNGFHFLSPKILWRFLQQFVCLCENVACDYIMWISYSSFLYSYKKFCAKKSGHCEEGNADKVNG